MPAPKTPRSPEPIRFSANCLIGGTGLMLEPGARVAVTGSEANDGVFTVIEKLGHNDNYWLAVTPHVKDEKPSFTAVVEVLT